MRRNAWDFPLHSSAKQRVHGDVSQGTRLDATPGARPGASNAVGRRRTSDRGEWAQHVPDERESRLMEAMEDVHEHGVMTNKAYRELTGVSDRTAHRDLELLGERGRRRRNWSASGPALCVRVKVPSTVDSSCFPIAPAGR